MQECCDYEDYDNRVNIIEVHHLQRKQKQFLTLTPVVELTQRYVAPNQEIHFNQQNQTSNEKKGRRKQRKNVQHSLIDFDIFPSLRPPPVGDSVGIDELTENTIEVERVVIIPSTTTTEAVPHFQRNNVPVSLILDDVVNEVDVEEDPDDNTIITHSDCPGWDLRTCVDACVPLPLLRVYGVCVRECARRCP